METQGERTKMLRVRLTPAEWDYLQENARVLRLTVSQLVRNRTLHRHMEGLPQRPTEGATLDDWTAYLNGMCEAVEGIAAAADERQNYLNGKVAEVEELQNRTDKLAARAEAMLAKLRAKEQRKQSAERGDANAK